MSEIANPSRYRLRFHNWKKTKKWELSEYQTFLLLDRQLGPEWEIFHQPSLSTSRPDFILASRYHGAVVVEVKHWDVENIRVVPLNDESVMLKWKNKPNWRRFEDPVSQVSRYEKLLFQRCSLGNQNTDLKISKTILFLHRQNSTFKVSNFIQQLDNKNDSKNSNFAAVTHEEIKNRTFDVTKILPPRLDKEMGSKTWNLLYFSLGSLVDFSIPGYSWNFNPKQKQLTESRTESGLRRIRGVAGSGKSVVLAKRAVNIISKYPEKRVLIVCYNITLVNLLHLMAIKFAKMDRSVSDLRNISFVHFHEWIKDISVWTNHRQEYKIWNSHSTQSSPKKLKQESEKLVDWIDGTEFEQSMYDAIFVDEGQDFHLEWWDALKKTLKPGGEMLLVADSNQDLYGRADRWTENQMIGSGFSGKWVELEHAYRFPQSYYRILSSFCDYYLEGKSKPLEPSEQRTLFEQLINLNFIDLSEFDSDEDGYSEHLMNEISNSITLNSETVLLIPTNNLGKKVIDCIPSEVDVVETFSGGSKSKHSFTHHHATVKATTFHSFKGWEASNLIIIAKKMRTKTQKRALYTALTRLKPTQGNSSLTFISLDKSITKWWQSSNF